MVENSIIEECIQGNFENLRMLVRKTSEALYPVVFRMTGNNGKAEDIVQETMITVWQKIGKLKSPGAYKAWVFRIAVNKCYDYLRSRKSIPETMADEGSWKLLSASLRDNSSAELENTEIAKIVGALAASLSPKQKAIFVLSDIEDMTPDEIARITGFGKASIKANLHFARRNIAGKLEKYL
ncbi:MAG: sigma-70 family RNA polymerase sigma factor [Bacteroidales bacterium]|nr:sigma-70 family RNA polymerase sigma factor [Bacteroidales bacterium]